MGAESLAICLESMAVGASGPLFLNAPRVIACKMEACCRAGYAGDSHVHPPGIFYSPLEWPSLPLFLGSRAGLEIPRALAYPIMAAISPDEMPGLGEAWTRSRVYCSHTTNQHPRAGNYVTREQARFATLAGQFVEMQGGGGLASCPSLCGWRVGPLFLLSPFMQ